MKRRAFLISGLGLTGLALFGSNTALAATPLQYSPENWAAALASGKPVLVHVHAGWCPTCRAQAPILDKITSQAAFKSLNFIRVDFDADKDFRKTYNVASQSTVLVFKGGKEVARSIGVTSEETLLMVAKTAL